MEQNKYIYVGNDQAAGPLTMDRPTIDTYQGGDWTRFNEHLKSLHRIDIVGEHSFLDGQILEVNKDFCFEIRPLSEEPIGQTGEARFSYKSAFFAIPLKQVQPNLKYPTDEEMEVLNAAHSKVFSKTPTRLDEEK